MGIANALKDCVRLGVMGLSYLTPRLKSKWIFGSNMGYSNNAKYLFLHVNDNNPEINAIWISDSQETVVHLRKEGYKAYYKKSFLGLYHALTAKVFCYNSYAGDINAYASLRAYRVNLWHGVGIKNIEFKINSGPLAKIFTNNSIWNRFRYINHYLKPDLFLSTSAAMTKHFKECFRLDDKNIIEGVYPRCEIFNWPKEKLIHFIHTSEPSSSVKLLNRIQKSRRSIIYMPTWRDSNIDFFELAQFDFEQLNLTLKEHNDLFLLKLHPATNVDLAELEKYSNIILVSRFIDIYPLLPFTDILITDYSSIYYDYLLMEDKYSILYPFDIKEYILKSRDLIMRYQDAVGDNIAYSFEELVGLLKDNGKLKFNKSYIRLVDFFWNLTSNKLTVPQIVAEIISKRK